ncbi:hypothetical protein [Candidatus Tisiphia endosymbiont of Beris chalybata]|uniref:hypothetical protein n=1 Tax=Candidatus Tisiphia endosymbiont of Beris chalybata TaxID=3066262 RepID=UPI00312C93CE
MNNTAKILLLSATFLLQGCATVFSGTTQPINIKVVESNTNALLADCNCIVTDGGGGQQVLATNPGVVRVSKAQGGVQVTCQKAGYRQLNTSVGDSFNATTIVNVLFWPGFIVDAVTGAYKKLPSHYVVSMQKI